jgi:3-phenylpropionate/cinnamic acid dioxygenase small subunit
MTPVTDADITSFIYHEVRLLDEHRFDEWLDLFSADGRYWMPLEWGQTDARLTSSLMDDDLLLLRVRVERLKANRTFSQKPKSRCHHVLQPPVIDSRNDAANLYQTYTPFHYLETRLDEQTLFAGWSRHTLIHLDGKLMIKLKRVDLINADAAFGSIQLFM